LSSREKVEVCRILVESGRRKRKKRRRKRRRKRRNGTIVSVSSLE